MEDREPIAPGDYRYYEPAKPGSLERDGSANALTMREKALRDIKAVHTRWYHRGEITAEQAVIEMEAIAVSVWQREHSPNKGFQDEMKRANRKTKP